MITGEAGGRRFADGAATRPGIGQARGVDHRPARAYDPQAWWFIAFPGMALLLTTLAFNLFGDGVRDAFDPRADPLLLVFTIFYLGPNDVARTLAGRQATPQTVELVRQRLGLDEPVWRQYTTFLGRALRGDLGYDYYHQVPVTSIIADAIPKTLSVVVGAAVLWLLLGVFNGVVSAVRPRSAADRGLTVFSLVFSSMPTFLLGLLLLYFLYYRLTLAGVAAFPAGGYVPLLQDPMGWLSSMILPWLTLALVLAATYTRLTRGSMPDVLGEDYIRTARSTRLSERRVVYTHGLRSAVTPVVTQFGIDVGQLVGGVVVVETVFSIDGLGRTAITAINQEDLPVISGIVLFASAVVVVANLLVDLAYAWLDPRVRVS